MRIGVPLGHPIPQSAPACCNGWMSSIDCLVMSQGGTHKSRNVLFNSRSSRSPWTLRRTGLVFCLACCISTLTATAEESWSDALARMPLGTSVRELNRTNCVELMLRTFQSNSVVKALVFMPAATDELYLLNRANAQLTNSSPTLLDAVAALTNQTF